MRKEELAIKHHALFPLVDVARVLALEAGTLSAASTHERFLIAAERMGGPSEQKELLEECSRAFLLVHYARVSQGLQRGTDGSIIRPIDLNPEIRTLLVTSFRTILRLLEATALHFGVPWRK
jgi:signal-transduction protein with cAMP-binding, CBS, and nucleotidyltransferase domain